MAQMVKNLPAMQETWVQFLGQEDPLGKGMAAYSTILAWRIPLQATVCGVAESDTTEQLTLSLSSLPSLQNRSLQKYQTPCFLQTWVFHLLTFPLT